MTRTVSAVALVPTIAVRGVDAAQIGAIGQWLFARQAGVDLDPPQQIGARAARLLPTARNRRNCRSAKHSIPLRKALQHGFGQGDLAGRIGPHLGAKQHMGAVLDQRHEAQLRKGALPATGARATEGLLIGALVGDLQGAAVHAHQAQAAVPGPLGGGHRNRLAPPRRATAAAVPTPGACAPARSPSCRPP